MVCMPACCAVRGNVDCGRLLIGTPAMIHLLRFDHQLPLRINDGLLHGETEQESILETQLWAVALIGGSLIRHVVKHWLHSVILQALSYCEVDFRRGVARELATATTQDRPI